VRQVMCWKSTFWCQIIFALCANVSFSLSCAKNRPTNLFAQAMSQRNDCKTLQWISLWTAMNILDTMGKVSIGQSFWFAEILVLSCDLKKQKKARVRAGEQNAIVPTDVSETRNFTDIEAVVDKVTFETPMAKSQMIRSKQACRSHNSFDHT